RARGVFWPALPRYRGDGEAGAESAATTTKGFWPGLSHRVAARPRLYWLASAGVLGLFATGLFGLRADGIGDQDFFTVKVDSVKGLDVLAEHFDAGATSP